MARPARITPTKAKPKAEQNGQYRNHLSIDSYFPPDRTLEIHGRTFVFGDLAERDELRMLGLERAMYEYDEKRKLLEGNEAAKADGWKELIEEWEPLGNELHDFLMELVRKKDPEAEDLEPLSLMSYLYIFQYLYYGQTVAEAVLEAITDPAKFAEIMAAAGDGADKDGGEGAEPPLASTKPSSSRATSSRSDTVGSRKRGSTSRAAASASTSGKRSPK